MLVAYILTSQACFKCRAEWYELKCEVFATIVDCEKVYTLCSFKIPLKHISKNVNPMGILGEDHGFIKNVLTFKPEKHIPGEKQTWDKKNDTRMLCSKYFSTALRMAQTWHLAASCVLFPSSHSLLPHFMICFQPASLLQLRMTSGASTVTYLVLRI